MSQRHIKNHVCIADGETVILGGLREKVAEDSTNKLPFIGELPGIGKLFGNSKMSDESKEMFIFITPRIIFDDKGQLEQIRYASLSKRPGDLPEFLERVSLARKKQKARIFSNSVKLLFGTFDD